MLEKFARLTWPKIIKYSGYFSKVSRDEMIGEVLVSKRIITESQLQEAIEAQKEKLFQLGKAIPLGQVIVELGCASEDEIVEAVNEHYNISISSLSDNLKGLVRKIGDTLTEELSPPRIPIWFQLSVATMFVLAVSIAVLSYVILERQRANLYDQTVKLGMVSLNYFSDNAKIPLLTNDTLLLNTLISQAESVEGHFYAFIVDIDQVIKAHTDHKKIDKFFEPFPNVDKTFKKDAVTYFNYTLPGETHVLNLSMPIVFKGKKLGDAHAGLSIDFIEKLFLDERAFFAFSTLITILLGMFVAVIFSLRFSRPVSTLVHATSQIAKGNYGFKVDLQRNDELGTLGEAFNRMGNELFRQSLMKESFGKYVGP